MKFAHYLQEQEHGAPEEWRGKFLKYKDLKKLVKRRSAFLSHSSQAELADLMLEQQFFLMLEAEILAVNREFQTVARQVIEAKHPGKARHLLSVLTCCGTLRLPAASAASRQQRLAAQAHWCRHYARVNAVGLRKIVKKYDKLLGCNTGSRFLQEVWAASSRGQFLHSPMLDELRAMEAAGNFNNSCSGLPSQLSLTSHTTSDHSPPTSQRSLLPAAGPTAAAAAAPGSSASTASASPIEIRLASRSASTRCAHGDLLKESEAAQFGSGLSLSCPTQGVPRESAVAEKLCGSAPASSDLPEYGPSALAIELATRPHSSPCDDDPEHSAEDEERKAFTCPICLELLYKPLGLACGHKFCQPCALRAAGMGCGMAPLQQLLQQVPEMAPCPSCRQPGMFRKAQDLPGVCRLIMLQWPEEYLERSREERRIEDGHRKQASQEKANQRALSTLWHYM